MATDFSPNSPFFSCENCQTISRNKKDYSKHLLTRKHITRVNPQQICPKISQEHKCSHCDKTYDSRSGLWRHYKKCTNINTNININPSSSTDEMKNLTTMMMQVMKTNEVLQKQMIDICRNNSIVNNTTNNTHHVNSHNKTFNLMFFLNEQCKDAMNMSEFVESFELKLEDLESVGQLGYVDGITKIFVDKLSRMDIHKRPMHCSDAKREILYIKDEDKWEREKPSNPKLRKAVRSVSFKNMKLANLWSDTYPESKSSESRLNDVYMKLVIQSTGGKGEISDSENKIIRRIVKEIVIEKN
jgi:hypothetical protein